MQPRSLFGRLLLHFALIQVLLLVHCLGMAVYSRASRKHLVHVLAQCPEGTCAFLGLGLAPTGTCLVDTIWLAIGLAPLAYVSYVDTIGLAIGLAPLAQVSSMVLRLASYVCSVGALAHVRFCLS